MDLMYIFPGSWSQKYSLEYIEILGFTPPHPPGQTHTLLCTLFLRGIWCVDFQFCIASKNEKGGEEIVIAMSGSNWKERKKNEVLRTTHNTQHFLKQKNSG